MNKVGIVTDSTADIPVEDLATFGIEMVPAQLIIDGESYEDGRQLSRTDFYTGLPGYSSPPTTATPSPAYFKDAYDRLLAKGVNHILSIHVATTLSGMLTSASQGADGLQDVVHVIDSGQLSLGLGFQVMEAAQAAMEGKSLEEVRAVLNTARENVRVIALIDTLEYLRRSGRVSWLQAGVGDLLRIKQLLAVHEGEIVDMGKARTFDRALSALLSILESWGPCRRVAVLHTGVPVLASKIAGKVRQQTHSEPFIVEVTTIIGAHVGPGSVGLAALLT